MEKREQRRTSFVIPAELEDALFKLRERSEYSRMSFSDLVRMLLAKGLEAYEIKPEVTRDA